MHGLPANTLGGIFGIHRRAIELCWGEHNSIGHVAVMRNRNGAAACHFFISRQIVPQRFRIFALEVGERTCLSGLVRPIAKNDDAVKVVAQRRGRPLVTGKRGKNAGFVIRIHGFNDFVPKIAIQIEPSCWVPALYRSNLNDVSEGSHAAFLPGIEAFIRQAAPIVRQQARVRCANSRCKPQHFRVLGNGQKIKRTDQLNRLSGVRNYALTSGHAKGIVNVE